ncbi:zinc finger BED domain-containing protein 5-like [Scomber scombrus]|uniref:Zinc finger BED domain-containing protein 5-like n=1 Tax=Scomber scombrus TaxID=13677 RepID=A0AAV1Q0Y8_SCOSC
MGNDNAIAVETSYLLSELIAKTGKPHTDGETFLLPDNVLDQLIQDVKASRFYAIQLDESTDIANVANLLAYIRYEKNSEIKEDFFSNGIEWSKCVGLSTDGTAKPWLQRKCHWS